MISIHALREEGDLDSDIAQIIYKISIHALREEGDRVRVAGEFPRQEFLSTPSARRATLSNRLWLGRLFISIHALREEGDSSTTFS